MLVLYRAEQRWEDRMFREFPQFLRSGDCLVLNDSRVFPSRLLGRRAGVHSLPVGKGNPKRWQNLSGEVEVFLIEPASDDAKTWTALVHPGRKMRVGERILVGDTEAEIVARGEYGERTVRFHCAGDVYELFEKIGHVPLPPYIKRPDTSADRERYQTVFARATGSVAAPTAGLHFTPEILEQIRARGIKIAEITLHIGLGTFQPVRTEKVEDHKLHREQYEIPEEAAQAINRAKAEGRRVVAVGTTTVRTLEHAAECAAKFPEKLAAQPTCENRIQAGRGEAGVFIYPGYRFRIVDTLLTNFHLPQSTLLMLVCALGGKELVMAAYRHAVEAGYRFYSYGDCMFIE